jgi:cytochrome c oxidase subunit 2
MVTEFGFTPKYTTEEMRLKEEVIEKTNGINKIRRAKGEEEMYEFNYLLLCNKICGASHYNMQMKITVVEQDEYDRWIAKQPTLASVIK